MRLVRAVAIVAALFTAFAAVACEDGTSSPGPDAASLNNACAPGQTTLNCYGICQVRQCPDTCEGVDLCYLDSGAHDATADGGDATLPADGGHADAAADVDEASDAPLDVATDAASD